MEMSTIVDYMRAHAVIIFGIICALPIVYLLRRYIIPPILYLIELTIYMVGMHLILHFIVVFFAWFKNETTISWSDDIHVDPSKWHTPLEEFWKKALYFPVWLYYLEIALVVVIIILMIKFRPMHTQKKKVKPEKSKAKKFSSSKSTFNKSTTGKKSIGGKRS